MITKLKATRDRLGKTTTLITFKTDRLKSAGIFTVVITQGGFVILYHFLFKIIQGVDVIFFFLL